MRTYKMTTKTKLKSLLLLLFLIPVLSFAEVKLPKLVSDGMILQRDANVRIWGWAANGEKVTIRFMDAAYAASANDKGEWEVMLPKMEAGGPYKMEITASNSITINDILVGRCLGLFRSIKYAVLVKRFDNLSG